MRLFGKIDGSVNRFDRAQWLTSPFDLAFVAPAVGTPERVFATPPRGAIFEPLRRGAVFAAPPRGEVFDPGGREA